MSSSSPYSYDLIVIGAGPGGYVCAFRAAQLGLKVALVDKRPTLGGTCLNVGCIPSKALLHSSEHFAWAKHHATEHGIKLGSVDLDLPSFLRRKDDVVAKLVAGVAQLAKARKVTVVTGAASFVAADRVAVRAADGGEQVLTAKNVVVATGSAPVELPFLKFDGKNIVSSDHAIAFDSVPKKLVVVGGGALKAVGGAKAAEVIPQIISGEAIIAFAYAEPQGRYNLADLRTTAKKDGAGYVINGHKAVVIGAPWADSLIVTARTGGGQRDEKGVSVFVVDKKAKGVSCRDYPTVDGLRASPSSPGIAPPMAPGPP